MPLVLLGLGALSSAGGGTTTQIQVAPTAKVGQAVKVCVAGLPGNNQDWMTVVPAKASATTYAEWAYSNGLRSFCKVFTGQSKPGKYEVRVYFNWPSGSYKIQARQGFTVR